MNTKRKGRKPTIARKTDKREVFEDFQKLKGRILGMCRSDFKKSPQYAAAKKRAFLGKTIYKCESCGQTFYTGSSQKNYETLREEQYPNLIRMSERKALDMDHIECVIPYEKTTKEMSLDEIVPRIYCHEDKLQYICKSKCHKEKTAKEKSIRAKYQQIKKLEDNQ